MNSSSPHNDWSEFWKIGLSLVTASFASALFAVWRVALEKPEFAASVRLTISISFLFVLLFISHLFTWLIFPEFIKKQIRHFTSWMNGQRGWAITLSVFALLVFAALFLRLNTFTPVLNPVFVRIFFLVFFGFIAAWFLSLGFNISVWDGFSAAILGVAMLWKMAVLFPYPLDYPFSLDWSETSWYYYASFFFDNKLYGTDISWPYLDIGRPLLLSPIYLLQQPSLIAMRLWQFTLWFGTASLVAWALWKRLKLDRGLSSALFILWGVLWMLTGPVYMHLSLIVAIVLLGFDRDYFARSLFWIGFASILGGIFRLNWIPVPAILGLTLYFLEQPLKNDQSLLQYLARPVWLGLSQTAIGASAFIGYLYLSGRADTRITSKFSAEFLWYRLWPNATLSTGIIIGALLVSAALIMILYLAWRKTRLAPLRGFLLLTMLLILFAGGTYASLKIGGGNNLHNLDAYLVMLMIWGSYAMMGRLPTEHTGERWFTPRFLMALLFLSTASWGMISSAVLAPRNIDEARKELVQLQSLIREASATGQEVLFIQNRHLITFGYLKNVPLVTEFELEELTEIAISNDAEGAQDFQDALREHRYDLIITGVESGLIQDIDRSFAAENNAWKRVVFFPLQAKYNSILVLPESGIEVYAPKP